jgi:hypothetical protein
MRSIVEVEDKVVGVDVEEGGVVTGVQLGDGGGESEEQEAGEARRGRRARVPRRR